MYIYINIYSMIVGIISQIFQNKGIKYGSHSKGCVCEYANRLMEYVDCIINSKMKN